MEFGGEIIYNFVINPSVKNGVVLLLSSVVSHGLEVCYCLLLRLFSF